MERKKKETWYSETLYYEGANSQSKTSYRNLKVIA